ncbi:MAG: choice-of-anchor J domain-containing protein [Telluria sp.]|nr:choice-of-anchor J domain-containing protein [Telluria sp.]
MKSPKQLFVVAALALASWFPSASHAIEPIVVLDEGFSSVSALSNWARINVSSPQGQQWFQGNPGIFAAQQGAPDSYAAVNHLSALHGNGWVDNWLITPEVSLLGPSVLSFFARDAQAPGFGDLLEVRFSPGPDLALTGFSILFGSVGGITPYPATWQEYSAGFDFEGTGRFAFRYVGDADAANYIGLDSVLVTTVPEADVYLMLLVGLAGVAFLRRRHAASQPPGEPDYV